MQFRFETHVDTFMLTIGGACPACMLPSGDEE
jgi:hypothetical protein